MQAQPKYTLIRSKRKTISIHVDSQGELIVKAPLKVSERYIRQFLVEKSSWIEKRLDESHSRLEKNPPHKFLEGEFFWYLGAEFELALDSKKVKLDEFLHAPNLAADAIKKKLTAWYKRQAREVITRRVEYFSSIHQLPYESISINSATTRWGSCTSDNKLNFSYRLIMAPIEVVDYVVIHELAHTVHKHHQKPYWELVEQMLPDYKARRQELKRQGSFYHI